MSKENEEISLGLPTKQQTRDLADMRKALQPWLAARIEGASGLEITDIRIPTGSGLANETVLLDAAWSESGKPRSEGFVVRIETPEPLFPGTTAERQYLMNRALADVEGVPVPKVLGLEKGTQVLGAPFYLMERIEGRVPHDDPPFHHRGWVTEVDTEERHSMFVESIRAMANLHRVDVGRFDFLNPNNEADGLRQQVNYYIDEFDTPINERHRVIDAGRKWLLDNYPGSPGLGLAWGDARVGNIIFDKGKCMAVLDWDMVSLAGAETDLAWWCSFDLSYTVSRNIPRLPGFGNNNEMLALWEGFSGRKAQNFDWHLAFTFYKAAVIVRRLAKLLKKNNQLPPQSAFMENNNIGVQYLASFLSLESDYPIETPWPGLDA